MPGNGSATLKGAASEGIAPDEVTPGRVTPGRVGSGRVGSDEVAPNGLTSVHGKPGPGPGRVIGIQRARMLAAMVEVSAQHGAANVTVAHVVERAGVSRRTFYEVFSDREACFLAAFDDAVARASRYVLDGDDPNASWAERIRRALTGLLLFLDVEHGTGQLLIVGSLGAGVHVLEHRRRVSAQMIAFIDRGREEAKAPSALPPLTAEGILGGVLSVLHARLPQKRPERLLELTGPLMSMIVLPYLGAPAARRELARPVPRMPKSARRPERNPLGQLEMRLTYRTVRVLMAIAERPGSSNRVVADSSEVADQGQMSRLLARLRDLGLIENTGGGISRGEPNAWTLTDKGWRVQGAIVEQTTHS